MTAVLHFVLEPLRNADDNGPDSVNDCPDGAVAMVDLGADDDGLDGWAAMVDLGSNDDCPDSAVAMVDLGADDALGTPRKKPPGQTYRSNWTVLPPWMAQETQDCSFLGTFWEPYTPAANTDASEISPSGVKSGRSVTHSGVG